MREMTIAELSGQTEGDCGGRIMPRTCTDKDVLRNYSAIAQAIGRICRTRIYLPAATSSTASTLLSTAKITGDWSVSGTAGYWEVPAVDLVGGGGAVTLLMAKVAAGDPNIRKDDIVVYGKDAGGVGYILSKYLDAKVGTLRFFAMRETPAGWTRPDGIKNTAASGLDLRMVMYMMTKVAGEELPPEYTGETVSGVVGPLLRFKTSEARAVLSSDTKTPDIGYNFTWIFISPHDGSFTSNVTPTGVIDSRTITVNAGYYNMWFTSTVSEITDETQSNISLSETGDHSHTVPLDNIKTSVGLDKVDTVSTAMSSKGKHTHGFGDTDNHMHPVTGHRHTVPDEEHGHVAEPHEHDWNGKQHRHTLENTDHISLIDDPGHFHSQLPHDHVVIDNGHWHRVEVDVTAIEEPHDHLMRKPFRKTLRLIERIP